MGVKRQGGALEDKRIMEAKGENFQDRRPLSPVQARPGGVVRRTLGTSP